MICVHESYYASNYIQSQFNYQKQRTLAQLFLSSSAPCSSVDGAVSAGRRVCSSEVAEPTVSHHREIWNPEEILRSRPRRRAGGYLGLRAVLTIGWDYLVLSDPAKICHGRDFLMASLVDLKSRPISSIPSIASSASTSHPLLTSPAPPRSPTSRTRTSVASDLSHWSSVALAGEPPPQLRSGNLDVSNGGGGYDLASVRLRVDGDGLWKGGTTSGVGGGLL